VKTKLNREIGDQYERAKAKELGGRRVSGSGSTKELKQDINFNRAKMQVKYTEKDSISIKYKDLHQCQEDAMNCGKVPLFLIGVKAAQEEWIMLPKWYVKNQDWWKSLVGTDEPER